MQLQERPSRTSVRDPVPAILIREDEAHLRSNDDVVLESQLRKKLNELGYPQVRQLRLSVANGQVSLFGNLNRYYVLQLAQSAVLQTPGVVGLKNLVSVTPSAIEELLAD